MPKRKPKQPPGPTEIYRITYKNHLDIPSIAIKYARSEEEALGFQKIDRKQVITITKKTI